MSEIEKYEEVRRLEVAQSGAQFSQEIADSLILRHNWGNLLSAAPLALSFVGACQVAASSPTAVGVKLQRPAGGFKYLLYDNLQANLVFLVDEGRKAFLEAETRMDKLVMHSRYLFAEDGVANRIVNALSDEATATKTLPGCMDDLREGIGECETQIKAIDDRFERWQDIAQELSQVATASEHGKLDEQTQAKEKLQAQDIRSEAANKEKENREKFVEEAERRMKLAEDAFKQASKDVPSGWDAIGMNFVEGLGTTVLSIGSAMVTVFSPNKYFTLGHSVVDAIKSGFTKDSGEPNEGSAQASDSTAELNFYDPAIDKLDILYLDLTSLLTLTQGKNGEGLDWDKLHKRNSADGTPLTYFRTNFQIILEALDRNSPRGSFSFDTKKIVEEALKVVQEIEDAVEGQRQISGASTQSEEKRWPDIIINLQERAGSLKCRRDNLPGLAMGIKPPNLKSKVTQPPIKGSVAGMKMAYAAANLQSAAVAMDTQRASYDASTEKLMENLVKISEIQQTIGRLRAEDITLTKIVDVLRASIRALAGLKEQITALLQFFKGIAAMVEFAARGPCKNLLSTLESGIERDATGVIAGISYRDFQKQLLLNTTFMIRGYFSVVFEVSRLYTDISHEYIIPGVHLVDKLGLSQIADGGGDQTLSRNKELEVYKENAVAKIRELAERKQKALTSRMNERIALIQETTGTLPASQQTKAIKETMEEELESTVNEIKNQETFIDDTARLIMGGFSDEL